MAGGESIAERAAAKAADILGNHKPMPLSDADKSSLRTIVEESEAEMQTMKKKK